MTFEDAQQLLSEWPDKREFIKRNIGLSQNGSSSEKDLSTMWEQANQMGKIRTDDLPEGAEVIAFKHLRKSHEHR